MPSEALERIMTCIFNLTAVNTVRKMEVLYQVNSFVSFLIPVRLLFLPEISRFLVYNVPVNLLMPCTGHFLLYSMHFPDYWFFAYKPMPVHIPTWWPYTCRTVTRPVISHGPLYIRRVFISCLPSLFDRQRLWYFLQLTFNTHTYDPFSSIRLFKKYLKTSNNKKKRKKNWPRSIFSGIFYIS